MTGNVDWAGWTQALVAVIAILAAPSTVGKLIARVRFPLIGYCLPTVASVKGEARSWKIEIYNRSKRIRDTLLEIYPSKDGNGIVSFYPVDMNDGGYQADMKLADGGCLEISIKRLVSKKSAAYIVKFPYPDRPIVYCESHPTKMDIYELEIIGEKEITEIYSRYLIDHRMMIVMLQLIFAMAIITAKLIYIEI